MQHSIIKFRYLHTQIMLIPGSRKDLVSLVLWVLSTLKLFVSINPQYCKSSLDCQIASYLHNPILYYLIKESHSDFTFMSLLQLHYYQVIKLLNYQINIILILIWYIKHSIVGWCAQDITKKRVSIKQQKFIKNNLFDIRLISLRI